MVIATGSTSVSAQTDNFPTAVDIAFGAQGRVIIATTAGLLVRKRDGEAFVHVCGEASGSPPGAFSPRVAIRTDGTFAATSYRGLRESRNGCDFELSPVAGRNDKWFSSIASAPEGKLWAATASSDQPNDILVSKGVTKLFTSAELESDRFWYISVAPSPAATRLYASGYMVAGKSESEVLKLVIVDGQVAPAFGLEAGPSGRIRIPLVPAEEELFAIAETAREPRGDVLYFSSDAASSFEVVLETDVPIVGVARDRSDATWVATQTQLFRAEPRELDFRTVGDLNLSCLGFDADAGLLGCRGDIASSGIFVSKIAYAAQQLETSPWLFARDIVGPCGGAKSTCAAAWMRMCSVVGASCEVSGPAPLEFERTSDEKSIERLDRTFNRMIWAVMAFLLIFFSAIGIAIWRA